MSTAAPITSANPAEPGPRFGRVLGTLLCLTTYDDFIRQCRELVRRPHPTAVDFVNTQVVTMRRHHPWFEAITRDFEFFIPDGMPLVWCLNRQGAGLRDRVYGPTFMRLCLTQTPAPLAHYLIGGSPECGARLRAAIQRWNPQTRVVGAYHGLCDRDGRMDAAAEEQVIEEINRLSPDFLWVGLGTPKQHAWIHRYRGRIRRGLLLGVGFAFDANAGTKRDAPLWMQRRGLTWVFRLLSEPLRLGPRYVRYNTLFARYLICDWIRSRAHKSGGK